MRIMKIYKYKQKGGVLVRGDEGRLRDMLNNVEGTRKKLEEAEVLGDEDNKRKYRHQFIRAQDSYFCEIESMGAWYK